MPDLHDTGQMIRLISDWICSQINSAGASGAVLGLSGGLDSATSAGLLVRALGADRVLAVAMPCGSQPADERDARLVAQAFGLRLAVIDLTEAEESLHRALCAAGGVDGLARSNIKPRLRMTSLYALAQSRGYLVCGNSNAAELVTGYFTKFGDSGCDFMPLAGFSKREVRLLARSLGVPTPVVEKPPSAGLWAGQTDESEMGLTYSQIDAFLEGRELDETTYRSIERRRNGSEHKRRLPAAFVPPFRL